MHTILINESDERSPLPSPGDTDTQHPSKSQGLGQEETPTQALLAGIKAVLPILLGVIPFALIAGAAMVKVGLTALQAQAMSLLVFAGASQLAMSELIGQGSPWVIIILTGLIINLRFVMYSASLAPHMKETPGPWRGVLAYLLTDQAYILSLSRFDSPIPKALKVYYYLGTAITLWVVWQIGTALGAILGAQVPPSWSLEFAVPLTFIALVVPKIVNKAALGAALVSGAVAVATAGIPLNLGLILASLCGIAAGVFIDGRAEA